jgi:hypothetical protein
MIKMDGASIEIGQLDTRYSCLKIPNARRDMEIFNSVAQEGILEAVGVIEVDGSFILIDGFKRLNACKKLHIFLITYKVWPMNEAGALLELLKGSTTKALHLFEEAKIIEELKSVHHLTFREIASRLNKSAAWVTVRSGFLKETTPFVLEEVFQGRFPASSASYTLRQFRRINKVEGKEIDQFVQATSGKKLSVRDIELLAKNYFLGGEDVQKQINDGTFGHFLSPPVRGDVPMSNQESDLLRDLEIVSKYMERIHIKMPRMQTTQGLSKNFRSLSLTYLEGIKNKLVRFTTAVEQGLKEVASD